MHPFLAAAGTAAAAAVAAGIVAPQAARPAPSVPRIIAPAQDTLSASSRWLNLLPDGETKRRFILDCTGCHQFDERTARPAGKPRSEAEWSAAVARMLGYAGPTTGFPVISSAQEPATTARWLAASLGERTPSGDVDRVSPLTGAVTEYLMPGPQDLPHDVAVEESGRVVVTGMFTHTMHVLDTAAGAFSQVDIPLEKANPRALEIDAGGRWWAVLGGPGQVARYDGLAWKTFDVGMYAHSIALDSSGSAWVNGHFTRDPEIIAQIAPDGSVRRVELPLHPVMGKAPGGPIPYEIRAAPDGTIWMSELQGNRIVSYDPASGRSAAYEMPTPYSGPRRFDIDSVGTLWIPAYAAGSLVRFEPRTGAFREYPLPIRDALPYVVRIDHGTGTVWIGTGAADALLAFTPGTGSFRAVRLPSRGALIRHLAVDPRNHDVWMAYGESPGKQPARIARFRARGGNGR
jgi:streptogramin lyase